MVTVEIALAAGGSMTEIQEHQSNARLARIKAKHASSESARGAWRTIAEMYELLAETEKTSPSEKAEEVKPAAHSN